MRIGRILLIGAAAATAAGIAAGPAVAAPSDTTVVTFEVLAGTLDIDAPATADLGTGAPGGTITGNLGAVTVTDSRASADASWEATVTSTVFTTGTGTPSQTILPAEVDYWSGPLIDSTGNGTFTPGQPTFSDREPLDTVTPVVAFTHTGGTGNNTAVWTPSLTINVPLDAEAGIYTGTVTHSVA